MPRKPKADLREIYNALVAVKEHRTFRALDHFRPYPKQQDFLDAGVATRERLFMAGNQVGKSHTGAFETACHLTGLYPDWWLGRRFDRPTRGWAAGETSLLVRDVQQKKLCGEPGVDEAFGTGLIPRERFVGKPSKLRGTTDAYDTVQVRHQAGGISILRFKSYEMGRKKFQGETLDFLWFDEEPDEEIYTEGLTRTAATNGIVFTTFTPLLGRSKVVLRFEKTHPDRARVNMTDEEAEHITPEMRRKNRDGWPEHEVDARAKGVPLLGSGLVYTTDEAKIKIPDIDEIPGHWFKLWALDFGVGRRFAAVLLLWDKDIDQIIVYRAMKPAMDSAFHHAGLIQAIAPNVPVAWPHDGTGKERGSGKPLARIYKEHGLKMLHEHATHADKGGYSVEPGIFEIQEREKSDRFKIVGHLAEVLEERRFYHRKEGIIVKQNDHLMDAIRTGVMMRRFATQVALGGRLIRRKPGTVVDGVDFDVFSGT